MELSVKALNGIEFYVDQCVETTIGVLNVLYIEFVGYSMTDVFLTFSNPEYTKTIYGLVSGEVQATYNGYEKLAEIFIVPNTNGNIRIRLEKDVVMNVLGE